MNLEKNAEEIGISADTYKQLCDDFVYNCRIEIQSLEKSISKQNMEQIYFSAHQIKGYATNLDFTILTTIAEDIEQKAKNNPSIQEIIEDLSLLKHEFTKIEKEMQTTV